MTPAVGLDDYREQSPVAYSRRLACLPLGINLRWKRRKEFALYEMRLSNAVVVSTSKRFTRLIP